MNQHNSIPEEFTRLAVPLHPNDFHVLVPGINNWSFHVVPFVISRMLLLWLTLLCVVPINSQATVNCAGFFVVPNDTHSYAYKWSGEAANFTWSEASAACHAIHPQGRLA